MPSSPLASGTLRKRAIPPSTLISHDNPVPKPWLSNPNPRGTASYWLVYLLILLGMSLGGVQLFFTYHNTSRRLITPESRGPYFPNGLCLQFDENFDYKDGQDPFDTSKGGKWTREVSMSGFGNGEFQMTTSSPSNSFVSSGMLSLVPTLTTSHGVPEADLLDGAVYNITDCSFNSTHHIPSDPKEFPMKEYLNSCSAISNGTTGLMINPIQSARISTLKAPGGHLRYGLVEIEARMPRGDWLWPALWMLPVPAQDNDPAGHYGPWPRSGEIDILESRGNSPLYTANGRNYVQGSLHWGIAPEFDRVSKSYSWWSERRRGFDETFRTYRLEWTKDFMRISVDNRLHTLLDYNFDKKGFFEKGEFPPVYTNSSTGVLTQLVSPWANAVDANSAPFDREFYLILSLGVGGRNGWFPDGQGEATESHVRGESSLEREIRRSRGTKPWLDRSARAVREFWEAKSRWWPTWIEDSEREEGGEKVPRGMQVKSVKMWGECK